MLEKSCNFFKWLCHKTLDGRDLKIERGKKKLFKLKNEVVPIKGMLKMSMVFDIFILGFNVVFLTMYFK